MRKPQGYSGTSETSKHQEYNETLSHKQNERKGRKGKERKGRWAAQM
jgi:hypothetical protein